MPGRRLLIISQRPVLTVDGVVLLFKDAALVGMMHPFAYRDLFGEDAYKILLDGPRAPSLYPEEDL